VYVVAEFIKGTTLRGWQSAAPRTWRPPLTIGSSDPKAVDERGRVCVTDFGLAHLE